MTVKESPRIHAINVEILDDKRLRCIVHVENNFKQYNLIIEIQDRKGNHLAEMSVLETSDVANSYVLHLDHPKTVQNALIVKAYLQDDDLGIVSQFQKEIEKS